MLPRALLIALLAVVVLLVFAWVEPGPLSIDEVTYRRMTHDLLAGHGLFLSNGYEELQSLELTTQFARATPDGHLAAQYPYGAPMLALPAFALLGVRGMFLVNALAYLLTVWLCYRVANQLLRDHRPALLAAGMLVVSFFTEYAVALWPHASTVAATLGAFSLVVTARQRDSWIHALGAGAVVGLGATLRLDALFVVPVLAAPFFFVAPTRVRLLVALLGGLLPGLAFLTATNYIRWGAVSPVSYGPSVSAHLSKFIGFAVAGAVALALAWIASRPRALELVRARARMIAAVLVVFGLLALVLPTGQAMIRGVLALAVDLRLRPSGSDPVLYYSGFKRALLQSAPFVVLALLARSGPDVRRIDLLWLAMLPAMLLAFFGARAWHGGLSMNMRYLLPALPFLCILAARTASELAASRRAWLGPIGAIAAAVTYFVALPSDFAGREHFVLTVPLASSALVIAAVLAWRRRSYLAPAALVAAGVSLGWSAAATVHDAVWSRDVRAWNRTVAAQIEPHLPAGALLFGDIPDPFYELAERIPGLRIAVFTDDIMDARRLIRHELGRGREIYAAVAPRTWETLQRTGALRDTTVTPIGRIGPYRFGRIHAP